MDAVSHLGNESYNELDKVISTLEKKFYMIKMDN